MTDGGLLARRPRFRRSVSLVPSTLKPLDPTQVELEISITPEEYTAAQDAAFRKLVRNAKIPGFRPGKAPRKIIERRFHR